MKTTLMDSLVPAIGWALLHFVWQGVLIGVAAAVALTLLRAASPRWRYGACAVALLVCLGAPLSYLIMSLGSPCPAASAVQGADLPAWLGQLQEHMPALVLAWALGVGLMATRLSLGLVWLSCLRRHAAPAAAFWQERLDVLARCMGLHRPVALKTLSALGGPVTFGCWRPVVLVPASLLTGMPVPLLEALLAHELAHVLRRDYLVNLLQSAVEALLFFHPVVWWLSTRMRAEREQVADELAAQALGDPHRLAMALHALSLHSAPAVPPGLAMAARGSSLRGRIERLVLPPPQTAGWRLAWPALLVAGVFMLVQTNAPTASPDRAPDRAAAPAIAGPASASLLQLPLNARHVLVQDDAGTVLMAKDVDAVVPIASITKLMTAMVLLDAHLDPNEKLRIVAQDARAGGQRHSVLREGVEVPRSVVLQLALLSSENRAAAALARTYPGGSAAFTKALRAKVHSLGLTRTHLSDATGAGPGNTSTANEVARMLAAAARYADIARITSNSEAQVTLNGRAHQLHNTNPLVGGKGWDVRLSKTGTSEQAGSCLTMRMRSGARDVTVVLLGADGAERRSLDALGIRNSLAGAAPPSH